MWVRFRFSLRPVDARRCGELFAYEEQPPHANETLRCPHIVALVVDTIGEDRRLRQGLRSTRGARYALSDDDLDVSEICTSSVSVVEEIEIPRIRREDHFWVISFWCSGLHARVPLPKPVPFLLPCVTFGGFAYLAPRIRDGRMAQ